MNEKLQANTGYQLAERKAIQYFALLYDQVIDKSYVTTLTEDIQKWKKIIFIIPHGYPFFHGERENLILGTTIDTFNG